MTTDHLRAEAAMVQEESGGELTTRVALLIGAADEIDRLRSLLEECSQWFRVPHLGSVMVERIAATLAREPRP